MIKNAPVFHHFYVTATNRARTTRAGRKHVIDVDRYVAEMKSRGARGILVEEIGEGAEPYETWRSRRPEPLLKFPGSI